MAVWTIKMNIKDKPEAFQFCKDSHFIGFGWGIPDRYGVIKSIDDYNKLREENNLYPKSPQLTTAIKLLKEINENHGGYIWTMDSSDPSHEVYYLCKTTGEYRHLTEHYGEKHGIANCLICDYLAVRSGDLVPSEAIRLLHSPGIVYKIENEDQEQATKLLYQAYEKLHLQK